jgi:hypothetical protein
MRFNHLGISFISGSHHSEPDLVDYSVSLAYAITWIASQRIITHMRGAYPTTALTRPIDLMECLEAGAEQTGVVITQMPSPPAGPPPWRISKETKRERGFNRDLTIGSQDDSVNTPRDCDIHVRIERSVVTDTKLEGGDPIERDVYASLESTWDQGYTV